MRAKNQHLVPIAFWIGFLALGLLVGTGGHERQVAHKPRAGHAAMTETLKQAAAAQSENLVASER